MYKIDKDVPIPPMTGQGRKGSALYPFESMKIGDSFAAPMVARKSIYLFTKKTGFKFASRKEGDDSVRIWRIE